ncbi:hypothetical protein [Ferrimonas futtsuensis]|uniref:hypothetical protein n=1 Tax=Ferrimonas futtsuensis TaxID=364764 RepID=UPI0012F794A3|nr:hypothetical protein [Ferrimonas futtsuensis]
MDRKSLSRRALKYAAISTMVMFIFVLLKVLINGAVGTFVEVVIRTLTSLIAIFLTMWMVFIVYLFFNPDADKPGSDI